MSRRFLAHFEPLETRIAFDAQMLVDASPALIQLTTDSFVEFQGELVFSVHGDQQTQAGIEFSDLSPELWMTDGSGDGTRLVDRGFAPFESEALTTTRIKSIATLPASLIYTIGQVGIEGGRNALFSLDQHGARMLREFDGNTHAAADPSGFVVAGARAFFALQENLDVAPLFATDGTIAGTRRLLPRNLIEMAEAGGRLFFTYQVGPGTESELFTTAGERQTVLVKELVSGPGSPMIRGLTEVDDVLYFTAEVQGERSIFASDGTAQGTGLAETLADSVLSDFGLFGVGGTLLFAASGAEDEYLAALDRDSGIVERLTPALPTSLKAVGAFAYFTLDAGAETQIWRSDGTPEGTLVVLSTPHAVRQLIPWDGGVLIDLARLEGVTLSAVSHAGDVEMIELPSLPGDRILDFESLGRRQVFLLGGTDRADLWVTDGTTDGTSRLAAVESVSSPLASLRDQVVFLSDIGRQSVVWRTDGTLSGTTSQNIDRSTRTESTSVRWLFDVGEFVYFVTAPEVLSKPSSLGNTTNGWLWRSDGTPRGTVRLQTQPLDIESIYVVEDKIAFWSRSETGGQEFWLAGSDADFIDPISVDAFLELVPAASVKQPDGQIVVLPSAAAESRVGHALHSPVVHHDTVFFSKQTDELGFELWQRGPQGESLVADVLPGPGSSFAAPVKVIDNVLYFVANDGVHGFELWRVALPRSADIDGDDKVGRSDFLILSANFGRGDLPEGEGGDLDLDGEVGFADFLLLASQFQEPT